jgi:hypothetical protein
MWRTQRLLLAGVKMLGLVVLTVVSLAHGEIPLGEGGTRRPRVSVINKLSTRPFPTTRAGRLARVGWWLNNQEVRGYLTVDPDRNVFLWEAEHRRMGSGPIAQVLEPLAAVRVTDRWTYRFGRRTAVVVALSSGADLWLTGKPRDAALRQLR